MKLFNLLNVLDCTTDIEVLIGASVGGTMCTALVAKGTAGDLMDGRFGKAVIEFISHDEKGVMQIIVSTDSYDE